MPYNLLGEKAVDVYPRQGTTTDSVVGSVSSVVDTTTSTTSSTTTTPTTTPTTTTTVNSTTTTVPITTTTTPASGSTTAAGGGDTTAAGGGSTTLAAAGSSAVAASTTDVTSASSNASRTSLVTATVVITSDGHLITTVTSTPTLVPSNSGSGSSSSNTGPIVGGVVGGIAAIGIIFLLFYCVRKRSKKQSLEGDIFDPDRDVQRPGRLAGGVDLADPQMEARPYNYGAAVSTAPPAAVAGGPARVGAAPAFSGTSHDGSHSQSYYNHRGPAPGQPFDYNKTYGESPYHGMPGSAQRPLSGSWSGGPTDLSRGPSAGSAWVPSPTTESTSAGRTDDGRSGIGAAFLGIPDTTSGSSHSAKAQQASSPLRLANVDEQSGPVVQHRDGGRVQPPVASQPQEVPPSYDSIPVDEAGAGSSSAGPQRNLALEAANTPEKSKPLS